jgi:hypothetical protein
MDLFCYIPLAAASSPDIGTTHLITCTDNTEERPCLEARRGVRVQRLRQYGCGRVGRC